MTKPPLDLELHINEEGEIILTELPEDLAEMVADLDPEHPLSCAIERGRLPSSTESETPRKDDQEADCKAIEP